jgi:GT2 family glycosyltransferase
MTNAAPPTPSLSVSIVLHHSSVELLRSTLISAYDASRRALNEGSLRSVAVFLVDNSLCPDYRGEVQSALAALEFDDFFVVKYVAAENNGGYGGGHNLVMPELEGEYHLVLNSDVELAETALFVGLDALRNDSGLALVSPRVLGSAGGQEFLCKSYPSVLVLLVRAFAPEFLRNCFRTQLDAYELRDICCGDHASEVVLASGCFMLLRRSAFTHVGGFNEKYFLYFEDFDLSLRLRESGRLQFLPAMQIVHHGGYAASKGVRHIWLFFKSGFRFFNDHGWKWI